LSLPVGVRISQVFLVFRFQKSLGANEIHRPTIIVYDVVTIFIGAVPGIDPTAKISLFLRCGIGKSLQIWPHFPLKLSQQFCLPLPQCLGIHILKIEIIGHVVSPAFSREKRP